MFEGKPNPFFQGASFKVKSAIKGNKPRFPEVEIDDEGIFLSLKLAKAGYFEGNPDKVLLAPVQTVLNVLHYESFDNDYFETYQALNKESE